MRACAFLGITARLTALLLAILLIIPTPAAAAETSSPADGADTSAPSSGTENTSPTLHIKAGGEGDGSDAAHPMGDIGEGFRALSEVGGTLVVWGRYELASSSCNDSVWGAFVEPEHSAEITVRGSDGYLVCPENYRYYMSGATRFENVGISGSGALLVAARCNPLVMGEGINIIGISDGVYLIGGYNGSNSGLTDADLSRDTSIEVHSGSYKYICGYNRGTAQKAAEGEARISIYGGTVNCVAAGISNNNAAFAGNSMSSLCLSIYGGEIYKICDTDMTAYGTLDSLSLDYLGGEIDNIIISDAVEASISFPDSLSGDVTGFLRFFDTYRQGEGDSVETRKIRIACIGDSITAGTGTDSPDTESYPAQLGVMLGDAYEVRNFSEGGRGVLSGSGNPYFESEAYAQSLVYQPDVVCIMLGTNDLDALISKRDKDGAHAAGTLLRGEMLSLIEKYTSLESQPIVYLLTPTVRTDDQALEGAIRDIAVPEYEKLAQELGIGYVDMYTVSKDMKHHFTDSVHPDAAACSYLATWLYSAVVSNGNIGAIKSDARPVEIIIKKEEDTTTPPDTTTSVEPDEEEEPAAGAWAAWAAVTVGGALLLAFFVYKNKKTEKTDGTEDADNG